MLEEDSWPLNIHTYVEGYADKDYDLGSYDASGTYIPGLSPVYQVDRTDTLRLNAWLNPLSEDAVELTGITLYMRWPSWAWRSSSRPRRLPSVT